jgi:hypothetical protein
VCSVANCKPRQLQAVLHRDRAVVDAGERMEVNISASWMDALHDSMIDANTRFPVNEL